MTHPRSGRATEMARPIRRTTVARSVRDGRAQAPLPLTLMASRWTTVGRDVCRVRRRSGWGNLSS
jgi:hypothetical protein